MYTSQDVAGRFNVNRQTVSNWAKEFARHLSPLANPEAGGHRRFTDEDLEVLALVHELKGQGQPYDVIHANLDSGQRGNAPIPFSLATLQNAMQEYQTRISNLEQALEKEMREGAEKDGMIRLLKDQLADAQKEILRLNIIASKPD